ncbi:hypothetical protein [Methylocapsa aurea]|uniref:hypothetical protein n=1 Tax=Methylocapsa aurea TaxID=663610 RepID=UPI003D18A88E
MKHVELSRCGRPRRFDPIEAERPLKPHSIDQEKDGGAREDQELIQPSGATSAAMESGRFNAVATVNGNGTVTTESMQRPNGGALPFARQERQL